jgi:hypothetical protein
MNRVEMQTQDDFLPPEVIELEEEADARGYFADDDDDSEEADARLKSTLPAAVPPVRSRRR